MKLEWKAPPPAPDYDAVAEQLQANPGEWALIFENKAASNSARLTSRGLEVRHISAGRGYKRGNVDIYARWPIAKSA